MSKSESNNQPVVSAVDSTGEIIEMLHDCNASTTSLCVSREGDWSIRQTIERDGRTLVPYSPLNNLIHHRVVLFPSKPEECGSIEDLTEAVRQMIHRYVDLSPAFEEIATHYVLLSWVYDRFTAVPYLRVRGDPGGGKTRFLTVIGSLCYKPIFASGASTVSPLFRMLDTFRGTLILDESDFRTSDEQTEIIKILNNGHAQGFPVLRTETNRQRELNPQAYVVYGPKLIATRGLFQDQALESRCLTEEMGQSSLRTDIPTALPDDFADQALRIRNQLLMFRLRYQPAVRSVSALTVNLEPRLKQILEPLLIIACDEAIRGRIAAFANRLQAQMIADRGLEVEARVLEVIRELMGLPAVSRLSVKEITDRFLMRFGDEYDRRVNSKWIGGVIRSGLHLRTQKSNGVFVIPPDELPKLSKLFERYGIESLDDDPLRPARRPRSP